MRVHPLGNEIDAFFDCERGLDPGFTGVVAKSDLRGNTSDWSAYVSEYRFTEDGRDLLITSRAHHRTPESIMVAVESGEVRARISWPSGGDYDQAHEVRAVGTSDPVRLTASVSSFYLGTEVVDVNALSLSDQAYAQRPFPPPAPEDFHAISAKSSASGSFHGQSNLSAGHPFIVRSIATADHDGRMQLVTQVFDWEKGVAFSLAKADHAYLRVMPNPVSASRQKLAILLEGQSQIELVGFDQLEQLTRRHWLSLGSKPATVRIRAGEPILEAHWDEPRGNLVVRTQSGVSIYDGETGELSSVLKGSWTGVRTLEHAPLLLADGGEETVVFDFEKRSALATLPRAQYGFVQVIRGDEEGLLLIDSHGQIITLRANREFGSFAHWPRGIFLDAPSLRVFSLRETEHAEYLVTAIQTHDAIKLSAFDLEKSQRPVAERSFGAGLITFSTPPALAISPDGRYLAYPLPRARTAILNLDRWLAEEGL